MGDVSKNFSFRTELVNSLSISKVTTAIIIINILLNIFSNHVPG